MGPHSNLRANQQCGHHVLDQLPRLQLHVGVLVPVLILGYAHFVLKELGTCLAVLVQVDSVFPVPPTPVKDLCAGLHLFGSTSRDLARDDLHVLWVYPAPRSIGGLDSLLLVHGLVVDHLFNVHLARLHTHRHMSSIHIPITFDNCIAAQLPCITSHRVHACMIYIYTYIYIYYIYIFTYIYIYIHTEVYIYIHMYMAYIYIYIDTRNKMSTHVLMEFDLVCGLRCRLRQGHLWRHRFGDDDLGLRRGYGSSFFSTGPAFGGSKGDPQGTALFLFLLYIFLGGGGKPHISIVLATSFFGLPAIPDEVRSALQGAYWLVSC